MGDALAVFDAALPVVRWPSSGQQNPLTAGQRRILVARNGVFIEAMTEAVHACAPLADVPLGDGLGLGDASSFFRWRYGPVPDEIGVEITERARRACPKEWAGLVVVEKGRYRLIEPPALSRGTGHVRYDSAGVDPLCVAVDVHSHGRGASYFSSTDDADDRLNPSPCFAAGVIGQLGDEQRIAWSLRAVVHGRFFDFGANGFLYGNRIDAGQ